jgi:hypothetical protein
MSDYGEYQYQQLKEDPDSFVNQKDEVMDKEFENVRRMAERGLKLAQHYPPESNYIDIFQHIIDEYEREAEAIKQHWLDKAVEKVRSWRSKDNTEIVSVAAHESLQEAIKELKK